MSISVLHVTGFTPFPFNQCWNMASQHATGLFDFCRSIMSNWLPTLSKLSWHPTFLQSFATVSTILTRSPFGSFISDSLSRETSSVSVILSLTVFSHWGFCGSSWAFSCMILWYKRKCSTIFNSLVQWQCTHSISCKLLAHKWCILIIYHSVKSLIKQSSALCLISSSMAPTPTKLLSPSICVTDNFKCSIQNTFFHYHFSKPTVHSSTSQQHMVLYYYV